MARATMDLCDLCLTPLEGYSPKTGRVVGKLKQGLVVVVGYSNGGWGYRKNHINFSGEVCKKCYDIVMDDVIRLDRTIQLLKEGVQVELEEAGR